MARVWSVSLLVEGTNVSIKPRRSFNYPRHRNEEALIYRLADETRAMIRPFDERRAEKRPRRGAERGWLARGVGIGVGVASVLRR